MCLQKQYYKWLHPFAATWIKLLATSCTHRIHKYPEVKQPRKSAQKIQQNRQRIQQSITCPSCRPRSETTCWDLNPRHCDADRQERIPLLSTMANRDNARTTCRPYLKGKEGSICTAPLSMQCTARILTNKVLRHGSHSFTCKQHHTCLFFLSVHQMAPPQLGLEPDP